MASGSINERKLWSVSPSAIDTYQKCPRTWYYGYVLGIRGPTPPHMAKGTSIHAALEHYQKTGEVLIEHENRDAPGIKWPVMEFVQAAIPHLPKPMNDPYWDPWREKRDGGLMLEQSGEMGTWLDPDGTAGPQMRQFIDHIEAYPDRAVISDYKTTSDWRYCKTPDELAHNTQLICNAKWLFSESDYKTLTLRHLYLLTKGKRPKANPVFVEVTREHVETEWQRILGIIREMAQWAKLGPDTADPLPPNTDHCSAYGGCFYRPNCGFEKVGDLVQVRRTSHTTKGNGESKMGILQDMMNRAGAAAKATPPVAPAAAPPPAPPVPPAPLATAVPKSNLFAKLAAAKKEEMTHSTPPPALTPEAAQAAAVAAGYPVDPPASVKAVPDNGYTPNGIIPPDAPSRISTPEEVAAANPPEETTAETTETGEKTKRKRRTKAEMEAARAAEATGTPEIKVEAVDHRHSVTGQRFAPGTEEGIAHPECVPIVTHGILLAPAPEPTPEPTPARAELFDEPKPTEDPEIARIRQVLETPDPAFGCGVQVLFIDCMPAKGWPGEAPKDLAEYIHAFNALAASSAGAADYRLIRYESKGYLATAIKVYMKGLPSVMYVDSRTSGADVFLETVIPYAKLVYRGVR